MSDKDLARQLNRSFTAVRLLRGGRGIPLFASKYPPKRRWKPREDQLLGRFPDSEVGRRLGCSSYVARKRRRRLGIPAWRTYARTQVLNSGRLKLLGTMPDKRVSERHPG